MLRFILKKLFWGGFHRLLSDRQYIMVRYWIEHGFLPDLDNPKRLSEKIHYLKLHDRSELRRTVADRLKVRDYVAEKIGDDYLIPLIGHYDVLTKDIWEKLPERFALKANHGSAMVKIVYNKGIENFNDVKKLTDKWLKTDFHKIGREWVYKGLDRKILAEKLITGHDGSIATEYKFFCFHGEVKLVMVITDRFEQVKRSFYDVNFKPVDTSLSDKRSNPAHTHPPHAKQALKISEKLAEEFNFIRVDLYLAKNKIYFGELTNFPGNGFNRLEPDKFDLKYGEMLSLEGVK